MPHVKKYNYADLRFHSYMYDAIDYSPSEFARHVVLNEGGMLDEISEEDFVEAFRRQYELIHSAWNDEIANALDIEIARFQRG